MHVKNLSILGYEHYHQMLSDHIRMEAFQKAIFATIKPGDTVVDLGAGTGILSFWAIKAGAAKVYSIEKTESIQLAKDIAIKNNFEDKIQFIQDNSKNVQLPEKVDVLISETLGSFGIDENTLEFINDAKTRFLKENGKMIPESIELFAAPFDDAAVYEKIHFWRKIPHIDFSPAFDLFSSKIMIESLKPTAFLSQPFLISQIDFRKDFNSFFENKILFPIEKAGMIHGVAGWFTVHLTNHIKISTSPNSPLTHWKQAVFPFKESIKVIYQDIMEWTLSVKAAEKNSDNTHISYSYRCSQKIHDIKEKIQNMNIGRNDLCPCQSGKKLKYCCEQ